MVGGTSLATPLTAAYYAARRQRRRRGQRRMELHLRLAAERCHGRQQRIVRDPGLHGRAPLRRPDGERLDLRGRRRRCPRHRGTVAGERGIRNRRPAVRGVAERRRLPEPRGNELLLGIRNQCRLRIQDRRKPCRKWPRRRFCRERRVDRSKRPDQRRSCTRYDLPLSLGRPQSQRGHLRIRLHFQDEDERTNHRVGTVVAGTTSATVSGEIDPAGEGVTYGLEFGTSETYGASSSAQTLSSSNTPQPVTVSLEGLQPGQTYHFRFFAKNEAGRTSQKIRPSMTEPAPQPPPPVETPPPTNGGGSGRGYGRRELRYRYDDGWLALGGGTGTTTGAARRQVAAPGRRRVVVPGRRRVAAPGRRPVLATGTTTGAGTGTTTGAGTGTTTRAPATGTGTTTGAGIARRAPVWRRDDQNRRAGKTTTTAVQANQDDRRGQAKPRELLAGQTTGTGGWSKPASSSAAPSSTSPSARIVGVKVAGAKVVVTAGLPSGGSSTVALLLESPMTARR